MFIKKPIALLLLCGMLLSATACGQSEAETQPEETVAADTIAVTETVMEETSPLYALPQEDFGGRDFRMSLCQRYASEMWVEEANGDVCNDAVYNRNLLVEDYYNTKIVPLISTDVPNEAQLNEITKTLLAGEDAYDLTAVFTYLAAQPALEGLYRSWDTIPGVELDKEWWIQSANKAFTIDGKQYVAVGDLSITTMLLTYVIFFNQQLAVDYSLPDLYETVLEGEWTIDTLIRLSEGIYQDLNGNEKIDDEDLFGFAGENVTHLDAYLASFDVPLIRMNEEGFPEDCLDVERLHRGAEKLYSLYYEKNAYIADAAKSGTEVPIFASSRAMFMSNRVNCAFTTLREMEDEYGILPYPKLEAAQAVYYSNSMDNYSLLSVPKTVTDTSFVGLVTEALTRENHYSVMPAYYDVALTAKYAHDEQSVAMLDLIMDGRQYDFSILHGSTLGGFPYLLRNTVRNGSTNIASEYAAMEGVIAEGLKELSENYKKLGD